MPKVTENRTPWMKFAAFAAAIGVITGFVKNFNEIIDYFKPSPPTVRIGWLKASSITSLEKCILPNGSTFELDKRIFSLGQNECLSILKKRITDSKNPAHIEDVKSARFLLLENSGEVIQRISLDGATPNVTIERVKENENIAICVAIEGKMNGVSINNPPTKVVIERTGTKTEVIEVPLSGSTLARGMGTCGDIPIEYNAPI